MLKIYIFNLVEENKISQKNLCVNISGDFSLGYSSNRIRSIHALQKEIGKHKITNKFIHKIQSLIEESGRFHWRKSQELELQKHSQPRVL